MAAGATGSRGDYAFTGNGWQRNRRVIRWRNQRRDSITADFNHPLAGLYRSL